MSWTGGSNSNADTQSLTATYRPYGRNPLHLRSIRNNSGNRSRAWDRPHYSWFSSALSLKCPGHYLPQITSRTRPSISFPFAVPWQSHHSTSHSLSYWHRTYYCLLVVYLTTISVVQILQHWTVRWSVNNCRILNKELVVAEFYKTNRSVSAWIKSGISNPRPATLCYVARGQICKSYTCYVAQNNVYTLWHEKYYSIIVTTVFVQKQNWYERCPWILDSM